MRQKEIASKQNMKMILWTWERHPNNQCQYLTSTSWWEKHPYKLLHGNLFPTGRAFTLCTYCSLHASLAKNMTTPCWHFFCQWAHTYRTVEYRLLWRLMWLCNSVILQMEYSSQRFKSNGIFELERMQGNERKRRLSFKRKNKKNEKMSTTSSAQRREKLWFNWD